MCERRQGEMPHSRMRVHDRRRGLVMAVAFCLLRAATLSAERVQGTSHRSHHRHHHHLGLLMQHVLPPLMCLAVVVVLCYAVGVVSLFDCVHYLHLVPGGHVRLACALALLLVH